jgi:Flp pilus assembly protein TadD
VRQNLALALGLQGKTAEAEAILRRDLPPEAADQNLRWLAARMQPGQSAAAVAEASPTARTWSSLQGG